MGRGDADKLDAEKAAQIVEDPLSKPGEDSPERTLHADDRKASDEPDVYLDVPQLKVDELTLEVDRLEARVALHATVAQLVQLDVGADASVDRVNLTIKGVEARAALKVRLDQVYAIIDRALTSLDTHPEMLKSVAEPAARSLEQLGGAAERGVGSGLLPEVGGRLESATGQALQRGSRAAQGAFVRDSRDSENRGPSSQAHSGAGSAEGQAAGDLLPSHDATENRSGGQGRAASDPRPRQSGSGAAHRAARPTDSSERSKGTGSRAPSSGSVRPPVGAATAAENARPDERKREEIQAEEHGEQEGTMTEEMKAPAQPQQRQGDEPAKGGAREELRRVIDALSKELEGLRRLDAR